MLVYTPLDVGLSRGVGEIISPERPQGARTVELHTFKDRRVVPAGDASADANLSEAKRCQADFSVLGSTDIVEGGAPCTVTDLWSYPYH